MMIIKGEAGSGKDTVAGFLEKHHGYRAIAQADPMKRFAAFLFGFTENQLWGPSEARNAEDARYAFKRKSEVHKNWEIARGRLFDAETGMWLAGIGVDSKAGLQALYGWFDDLESSMRKDLRTLTPRAALQTLGTEFGRSIDPGIWSRLAIEVGEKLLVGGYTYDRTTGLVLMPGFKGYSNIVITDGRFRNEILNMLKLGGKTLNLINPKDESQATESAGFKGHASEAEAKGIPNSWFTHKLINDKKLGLEHLEETVAMGLGHPTDPETWS